MKKVFSVLLVFALAGLALAGLAENIDYDEIIIEESRIPYEPQVWFFDLLGFTIQLPADWIDYTDQIEQQGGGIRLFFRESDGETGLVIDSFVVDLSKTSYPLLAEGLERSGMTDVAIKIINGYTFILFTEEGGNRLGAVLAAREGAIAFSYGPVDETSMDVFVAILSTLEIKSS